jgi:hypothetical protein
MIAGGATWRDLNIFLMRRKPVAGKPPSSLEIPLSALCATARRRRVVLFAVILFAVILFAWNIRGSDGVSSSMCSAPAAMNRSCINLAGEIRKDMRDETLMCIGGEHGDRCLARLC